MADVQGGLHAGYASPHHQDVGMDGDVAGLQGAVVPDPCYGGARQVFGLLGGKVPVLGDPGDLFPNRGHLKVVGVETCPGTGCTKGLFVESWGA